MNYNEIFWDNVNRWQKFRKLRDVDMADRLELASKSYSKMKSACPGVSLKKLGNYIEALKQYYDVGFRYVVRDAEMKCLVLFSLKPKKYRKEEFWGYVNVDDPKVIPCQVIFNTDITEIRWQNRYPTVISEFVKGSEL